MLTTKTTIYGIPLLKPSRLGDYTYNSETDAPSYGVMVGIIAAFVLGGILIGKTTHDK